MSESEPKKVYVNILEAIDHEKPIVEQIRDFERFKETVNRALGDAGIRLVTMALDVEQAPSGEVEQSPEEASPEHIVESAVVAGSLNEVRLMMAELGHILDAMSAGEEDNPTSRMLDYVTERIDHLKAIIDGESGPNTDRISVSEAAKLITTARHDELLGVHAKIYALVNLEKKDDAAALALIIKHITSRREAIDKLAARRPEQ